LVNSLGIFESVVVVFLKVFFTQKISKKYFYILFLTSAHQNNPKIQEKNNLKQKYINFDKKIG